MYEMIVSLCVSIQAKDPEEAVAIAKAMFEPTEISNTDQVKIRETRISNIKKV